MALIKGTPAALSTSDPHPMSALGQAQAFCDAGAMSALHPKADMCTATSDVRFVPKADIRQMNCKRRLGDISNLLSQRYSVWHKLTNIGRKRQDRLIPMF
jgi:hypothetical protein